MDLLSLRNEIDGIDEELLPLLLKRLEVSKQVAQYKIENSVPVLNQERENEILDWVVKNSGEYAQTVKTVFISAMDASRALQHRLIGGGSELRESVENALRCKKLSSDGKLIACQGVDGAYSAQAARKLFPDCEIDFHRHFEDVFEAVNTGRALYGIIPVENSTAGSVHESYDLIMKYRFYIVGAYDLRISHCIAAKENVSFDEVEEVYSHPQALRQCGNFITNFGLTGVNSNNTAIAAKYVSESEKNNIACICSESAAKKYNLKILKKDIQNVTKNTTRFIVISKKLVIDNSADKISLIFSAPHKTGSLYRVLGRFSMSGLNLTKLESRPVANGKFDYLFYADVEGNVYDEETLDLLCALHDELEEFKFLGNYKEIKQ